MDEVLIYLLILFFFVVLPALLKRLAAKSKSQAQGRQPGDLSAEEEPAEQAEGEDGVERVRRYLESIGITVRRPAAPTAQPPEPTTLQEPAAQERTVYQARPAEVQRYRETVGARRAPQPPPRREEPMPPRQAAPPQREPVTLELAPEAAAPAHPAARQRILGPLGRQPTLTDLQRAVILAEVIHRPDFDELPIDRLPF